MQEENDGNLYPGLLISNINQHNFSGLYILDPGKITTKYWVKFEGKDFLLFTVIPFKPALRSGDFSRMKLDYRVEDVGFESSIFTNT